MDELESQVQDGKKSTTSNPPIDNSSLVFTTTDPLGNIVQLKATTWNMHVLDGDNYRPEFIGQEEVIKRIIEDPEYIVPDILDNRHRYYGLAHLSTNNKIKPVKVVVDHSTSPGDICTIFSMSRMAETGERGFTYVRK